MNQFNLRQTINKMSTISSLLTFLNLTIDFIRMIIIFYNRETIDKAIDQLKYV